MTQPTQTQIANEKTPVITPLEMKAQSYLINYFREYFNLRLNSEQIKDLVTAVETYKNKLNG